jgi:rhodanese-related sulfurtransferase
MAKTIDASTLKSWLSDGKEIALLDVRELGRYSQGHPFFAVPAAYSRLEIDLPRLVRRMSTRLVMFDDGDGVAEKAARRAQALGYTDVHILKGGADAWKAAGHTLYEGVNVPSKAFGEVIEVERHTPRITARELVAMKERGENMVIVDGRTWTEYQNFNIPGGISCPNGELALRIDRVAPDPTTKIVVNCAGRTRSIIGAQTLIDFGVKNPVVALENGTQAWWLEGLQVERGADRRAPAASGDAVVLDSKRKQARAHAERHGVGFVDADRLLGWMAEPDRTTLLFDIREAEEYAAGHLPGFVHAPGGQLVQATDQWLGVRGARIVVADTEQIRAPMVAAWLRQLGHEAYVLNSSSDASGKLASLAKAKPADSSLSALPEMTPAELSAALSKGDVQVIDLRASMAYRKGHVKGAAWSIRPRIAALANGAAKRIVLVADDPAIAAAAALDLADAGAKDVRTLSGGFAAWQAAGLPVEASPTVPADADCVDFIFHTLGRNEGNLDAARAYLAWEINLTNQLDAQERGSFRI